MDKKQFVLSQTAFFIYPKELSKKLQEIL